MATLWLYLHFPTLQLDSLFQPQRQITEPATTTISAGHQTELPAPVCLLDTDTLLIQQLNAAAALHGIKAGMTLSMACALCHKLQVLPYQPEQEFAYLQQVAALLYQISADIALDPPRALWLRIEPMLALYGGLAPYLATLSQQLTLLQLQHQMALAHSAAAAQLLCFSQPGLLTDESEVITSALKNCALSHSQLQQTSHGQKVLQQLQSMGISTVGQLLAIPRSELSRRFSADLIAMLDQLSGHRPTVSQFYQPPEQFCQSLELLYQLEHTQQLLAPLSYLLQLLQNYLQLRDQHCYQLQLQLILREHPPLLLNLQSACAEYQQSRWLELFQLRLQQLKLPAPLLKMQLSASQTCAREGDSWSLFNFRTADGADEVHQQLPHTIQQATAFTADMLRLRSLLSAKLGPERVQQPALHADHRPELANGYQQQVLQDKADTIARHRQPQLPPPLLARGKHNPLPLRPGMLLAQPIPLRMQLQLQPGLERISTGWWDHQPIQRDYFIGRNQDGQWCWAFKNSSGWFLQGYFA